ncbi:MAG: FecR domain-containing protein, partial [Spirochaetes bacterium]|nr:FecR domain-containing protein [Spirochaetota bacterium]
MNRQAIPLLLALLLPLPAAEWARVKECSGQVTVSVAGDDGSTLRSSPVRAAQVIAAGQVLSAGPDGRAVLELDDGSLLELAKGSRLSLGGRENDGATKTFFTLLTGQVVARVKKLSASDTFQIATPTAIAGVRGTVFSVSVAESGDALIGVQEGTVEVEDADAVEETGGQPLTLAAKESAQIGLAGNPQKGSGFELGKHSYERWNAERQKQLLANLPGVLDALEKRFLLTAKAVAIGEELLRRDGKALLLLHARIEASKKGGPSVGNDDLELRKKMFLRVAKVGAFHKLMGARLQAYGPVLAKIYQLGKDDPRVRQRMEGFRKNAEGALKGIEERRRNAAKEMESQRLEWKEKFGEARSDGKGEGKKEPGDRDERKAGGPAD